MASRKSNREGGGNEEDRQRRKRSISKQGRRRDRPSDEQGSLDKLERKKNRQKKLKSGNTDSDLLREPRADHDVSSVYDDDLVRSSPDSEVHHGIYSDSGFEFDEHFDSGPFRDHGYREDSYDDWN
jgi:hypothetical protein